MPDKNVIFFNKKEGNKMREAVKNTKTKEKSADDVREILENVIDKRLEILDKSLIDAIRLLSEIYAEKRFISYLNEMRAEAYLERLK